MRGTVAKRLRKIARGLTIGFPERDPKYIKSRDVALPVEWSINRSGQPVAKTKIYHIHDHRGLTNEGTTRGAYRELKKTPATAKLMMSQ